MKAPPFAYVRAASLGDALQHLAISDAKAIAGGQSLLASLAFRLSEPKLLVDISRVSELRGITIANGRARIGALTTHATLSRDASLKQAVPLFAEAAHLIAHPAIRNRGTIGGSLAYADPASELPACVVALDADVVIASPKGERRVKASDFFTGLLSTALDDGELITAVEVPVLQANERTGIEEIARRSGDYAMAGAAVRLSVDGSGAVTAARVVCFGVGDGPILAKAASAAVVGKPATAATIAAAQAALDADLDPPTDQHGGADTKRHLARVVVGRLLTRLLTKAEAAA